MDMNQVKSMLKSFGLTEYEVKAYITLLRLGTSTAEKLSEIGNIPLPRVYDTITDLQRKGLVLVSKTRPKKFKSISPNRALKHFIDLKKKEFDLRIKDLKKDLKKVVKALSEIPDIEVTEKELNIWSTQKRKNVIRILSEQVNSAKKEILAFSGDLSWLPESVDVLRKAIKRGVHIRVLATHLDSKKILENIRRAKKLGLNVKRGYNGNLRGYVIDSNTASIAIKSSIKGINIQEKGFPKSDKERKYELIIIENPAIANAFKENFEFWWNKLS
jgi:sugar-specific transcriptional regulator TrmB